MTTFKTTAKKYCEDLITLAWSDTFYKNKWPYNLLYCYGNGRFSADCNNLIKALVNGREIKNAKAGSYQENLSVTGDITEYGLLNKCENVTTNFSKILFQKEPHVLYMSGHVGTYLGYEVTAYGNTYNVVECTAWTGDAGHDGIIFSYVDASGNRMNHKGGYVKSKWTRHGSMSSLIDCSVLAKEATVTIKPVEPILDNKLDAITYQENWMVEQFINDPAHYLKVGSANYLDTVFVQQYLAWFKYYTGDIDGIYGPATKAAAEVWQKANKLYADGEIGPNSWKVIRLGKS